MKVLHYYWIDPQDRAGRGGGVRLYMQSLVAQQRRVGWQVNTLASGLAHDLRARPPRWRKCRAGHYEIVNSGCLAPSHADFATMAQVQDAPTEATFLDFLDRTGPYDVVHVHSLEGLPAQCLALRGRHQATRLVMSLHNYHPFCPQVNLWWQETANCQDFAGGHNCTTCLPVTPHPGALRMIYRAETWLARFGMGPGRIAHKLVWKPLMRAGWRAIRRIRRDRSDPAAPKRKTTDLAALFHTRRHQMVALINAHCDAVLAVSDRTRLLAQGFGVTNVVTCYIGTEHAVHWARTVPRDLPRDVSPARPLRLAYLGYMRCDKGFGFLLDALEALPLGQAACLHLTIAAQRGDASMMARIAAIQSRFAGLEWHDGYRRNALDTLLADIHCGIVPPLWEDNLPQVALEMHARHIPILTSDRGGAQELGGTRSLTFHAGDSKDFQALIARLLRGEVALGEYWAQSRVPKDMQSHAAELAAIYKGGA